MNFLVENWFWIVLVLVFFWMHSKMHGGHGGRDSHGGHGSGMGCGMHHGGHHEPNLPEGEERSHVEH